MLTVPNDDDHSIDGLHPYILLTLCDDEDDGLNAPQYHDHSLHVATAADEDEPPPSSPPRNPPQCLPRRRAPLGQSSPPPRHTP
ncbi:hypothetical protein Hypma_009360 [Hypsizygus marmoreus]|uniref:Uncharacterized protein n=1 Tax=Hypsizygus marmoreus TaxID=39966 RepID=A0A369JNQ5_HYPMA|nr:hypothetical protein Hypma_009360 [Hypsizygus marmoreus]